MIGLGLSLMGGALAQNAAGGAEAVYYPAREAYCARTYGLSTAAYMEDIRRTWSDETSWFHADALFEALLNGTLIGSVITNTFVAPNYFGGHYLQRGETTIDGARLFVACWLPNSRDIIINTPLPQTIEFSCRLHDGLCDWQIPSIASFSVSVEQSDKEGASRRCAVYNNIRTFWGLSYQSEKGNIRVLYAPMTDGRGHSAIWSAFSQTLVEL